VVESPERERQKKAESRERELKSRSLEIKYWELRDSKMIAKLKAHWAERDALYLSENRTSRLFDYICTTCNRPFTTPRKLPPQNPGRCYSCTAYHRKKLSREHYARNHHKWNIKRKERKAKVPVEEPTVEKQPIVVWEAN
jgi:hypothetical protein